jgi:peptidoglycan/xylan/chitin deacetylase (PgdA/CDA1 family)
MLILNYHRVGFPPSTVRYRGMYVTPKILDWHIRLLKLRGYKFVTVSEGVRLGCAKNLVALTFDDGYRDNITNGFPVLNFHNVPATVYVVTGDVGGLNIVWQEAGDKVASDLMNWSELKSLEQAGWEIGSHAADHRGPTPTYNNIMDRYLSRTRSCALFIRLSLWFI